MARTSTSPLVWTALFVCVILTLAFTVLTLVKQSSITKWHAGDPDDKRFKAIEVLNREASDLANQVKKAESDLAAKQRELYRADQEAAKYRLFYSGNDLLGGVATQDQQEAMIRGENRKLKSSAWKLASELLQDSVKRMDALKAEYEGPERQSFPELDGAIRKRQDELQAVLRRITEQEAQFSADKDRLSAQLEALTAEQTKLEKQGRADKGQRSTHILQLEERIRQLLELELKFVTDIDPDGSVLEAEGKSNQLVIDLGTREHLKPGVLFAVFNYERGVYVDKGSIEIIQVEERVAVARILKQTDPRRNPIGKGDYIGNPVWDKDAPKVLVLAGEFARFTKPDLEGFIRATGGVVRDKLGPGVDFLVVQGTPTDRSDTERAAARQYQLQAMTEDMLLGFVQANFAPKH